MAKKRWDDGSATRDKLLPPLDCNSQAALASLPLTGKCVLTSPYLTTLRATAGLSWPETESFSLFPAFSPSSASYCHNLTAGKGVLYRFGPHSAEYSV